MALVMGLESVQVTISSGTSLSAGIAIGAKMLGAISMPVAWDSAALSFQVSFDGGTTYQDLHDTSIEVTMNAAANIFIAVNPETWRGINMIKVRSGTSASPVNQSAARIVSLLIRPTI